MTYDRNTMLIEVDGNKYHVEDLAASLAKAEVKEICDILTEANLQFPRKTRMDAMRSSLRPGIVRTRAECLTLDNLLNYRLLWFNNFSEEQMNYYFEYFKDPELNKNFAGKFYRNLLIVLVNNDVKDVMLQLIALAEKYVNYMARDIKIKDFMKSFDPFFADEEDSLDGLVVKEFRPVLYNSATKNQLLRLGKKYGITIPEKINKSTIGPYVADKLTAMGVDTTEFREKMDKLMVKDIRAFALENGLETAGELTKKEYIEYILQRAETTKGNYKVPLSDRVYEMNIPISDEETVYEKLLIEQVRMQEELAKAEKDLKKKGGEDLAAAQAEIEQREALLKEKEDEILRLQEQLEEQVLQEREKRAEQYAQNPDAEFVESEFVTSETDRVITNPEDAENKSQVFTSDDILREFETDLDADSQYDLAPTSSGRTSFGEASLVVYESQRQDIMILEKTTTVKARRFGVLAIILIVLIAILAIAIGATVVNRLVRTRPMPINDAANSLQAIQSKTMTKEADSPRISFTGETVLLSVSPVDFNKNLDIGEYYTSNSSGIRFRYFEREFANDGSIRSRKEIDTIDLSDVYAKRDRNMSEDGYIQPNNKYEVEVTFTRLRKRANYEILIDYRNIITVYGPIGNSTYVSFTDFKTEVLERSGSYESFFKTVLDLDPQHHYNKAEDLKTWFLDANRNTALVDKNKISQLRSADGFYAVEVYADHAAERGFTTRLMFNLAPSGSDSSGEAIVEYVEVGKQIDNYQALQDKILDKLEYKGLRKAINPEDPSEITITTPSNDTRQEYYVLDYWEARYDAKKAVFNISDDIPLDFQSADDDGDGIPDKIKNILLYPVFKRKRIDLHFYENDKVTEFTGYDGKKIITEIKIEDNELGQTWKFQGFPTSTPEPYVLDADGMRKTDSEGQFIIDTSKYFSHWETEDGVPIKFNEYITTYDENYFELRVYPSFGSKIQSTVYLQAQSLFDGQPGYEAITQPYNPNGGGIGFGHFKAEGRREDKVLDVFGGQLEMMLSSLEDQSKRYGYTRSDRKGLNRGLYIKGTDEEVTANTTFQDISNKNLEYRYNVVPFTVIQNIEIYGQSARVPHKVLLFGEPGQQINAAGTAFDDKLNADYPRPNHNMLESFQVRYGDRTLQATGNITFVIDYVLHKMTVAFFDNLGVEEIQAARTIKYNEPLPIEKGDGTKEFVGWAREKAAIKPDFTVGSNFNTDIVDGGVTELYAVFTEINKGQYRIVRNFFDINNKTQGQRRQIIGYPEKEKLPYGEEILVSDLYQYTTLTEEDAAFLSDDWIGYEFDPASSTVSVTPTQDNPIPTITLNFKRRIIKVKFISDRDAVSPVEYNVDVIYGAKLAKDIIPIYQFQSVEDQYFDGAWTNLATGATVSHEAIYNKVFKEIDPDNPANQVQIIYEGKYRTVRGYLQVFLRPTDSETNKPTAPEFKNPERMFSTDYLDTDVYDGYTIPHWESLGPEGKGLEVVLGDTTQQNFSYNLRSDISKYYMPVNVAHFSFKIPEGAIKKEGEVYKKYLDIKRKVVPIRFSYEVLGEPMTVEDKLLNHGNEGQGGYNPFFYGALLKETLIPAAVKEAAGVDYYVDHYTDWQGQRIIPETYRLTHDIVGKVRQGEIQINVKLSSRKATLNVYTVMSSKVDNTFAPEFDFATNSPAFGEAEIVNALKGQNHPYVTLHQIQISIRKNIDVYELVAGYLGDGYLPAKDPYETGTSFTNNKQIDIEGKMLETYCYIERVERTVTIHEFNNGALGTLISTYKAWHGGTLGEYFVEGQGGTPAIPLNSNGVPYKFIIDSTTGNIVHDSESIQIDALIITRNYEFYCTDIG